MSESAGAKVTKFPTGPKILDRSSILGKQDIPMQLVHVELWGGSVWVRGMDGDQRDRWERSIMQRQSNGKQKWNTRQVRARAVAQAVVIAPDGYDPEASNEDPMTFPLMFSDADVTTLTKKSAAALDLIFTVLSKLSGVSDEDMESLTENLDQEPSGN